MNDCAKLALQIVRGDAVRRYRTLSHISIETYSLSGLTAGEKYTRVHHTFTFIPVKYLNIFPFILILDLCFCYLVLVLPVGVNDILP
jgi:hypothetical protein